MKVALDKDQTPAAVWNWALDPGLWLTVATGIGVFFFLLWLHFKWGGENYKLLINNLAYLTAGLILPGLAWRTSTHPQLEAGARRGWKALALAKFFYWIGNIIWAYHVLIRGEKPWPSWADIAYLSFYPIALWGLLSFTEGFANRDERVKFWLDASTILVGVGTVIWYFLLLPIALEEHSGLLDTVLSEAYPIGDVLLLFGITAILLRRPRRRDRGALICLVFSMLLLLVGDLIFSYQNLAGTYQEGTLSDGIYLVSYFTMMVASQVEYLTASRYGSDQEREAPQSRPFSPLPYLAVALAYGLLLYVSRSYWGGAIGGLVFAAVVLTALVIGRQVMAVRESAKLRAEQATRETEARFSSLVRHSSDIMAIIDVQGYIRFISDSAERVIGYAPNVLCNTSLMTLVHPDDLALAQAFLAKITTRPRVTVPVEWRLRHCDGHWCYVETIGTNLLDDPTICGVVLNSRDLTERKALEDQLKQLAFHDALTQLANRTLFRDRVEHALTRTHRERWPVTVLFLDLDNFKTINDSLGHAEGDRLLVATAQNLVSCTRASDTVARLGGDEFAILIEDTCDLETAVQLAERIAQTLQTPFILEGKEILVTASIGIAQSHGEEGVDTLLRNADLAMYTAKSRGKHRYAIFEQRMHAAALERLELEADLRRGIERGEFTLNYQPIVVLESGSLVGVEALIRWRHPARGLILPATFIPLAEEGGLIEPLGRWVLWDACRQLRAWRIQHPDATLQHVAVNISGRQLQSTNLAFDVSKALAEFGLDPQSLVLEITESVVMHNTEMTLQKLRELKALGVRLAIDDFGTGYSSLSYLHQFPVDILKIDKTFIDRVGKKGDGAGLVQAIIALGETLNLQTVAEGVVDVRQLLELKKLGCQMGQGEYFSMPVSGQTIMQYWLNINAGGAVRIAQQRA